MPAERRPDAQTLLTVSEDTSFGIPALICACLLGIWPCPACRTWPKTTCSTCSGPTSARSSAAAIALPPRSVASSGERPPPSLPNGVRAAPRITVLGIGTSPFARSRGFQRYPRTWERSPSRLARPMRNLTVTARRGSPEETAADTRVVGLFEGESPAEPLLKRLVDLGEATAGLKKVALAHEEAPGGGERRVLVAGLGKREDFDPEKARIAAAAAADRAKELGAVSLSWAAPEGDGVAGGLVEGTLLRLYSFDRFKSNRKEDGDGIESLEVAGDAVDADEVERARVAAV